MERRLTGFENSGKVERNLGVFRGKCGSNAKMTQNKSEVVIV